MKISRFIGRKAADPEGFDDDGIVMLGHIVQNRRVHGRDQFEQSHIGIKGMVKGHRFFKLILIIQIEQNVFVMDGSYVRKIDA